MRSKLSCRSANVSKGETFGTAARFRLILAQAETGPFGAYLQATALTCYEGFLTCLVSCRCSNACTATPDKTLLPFVVVPARLLALRHRAAATCVSLIPLPMAKVCCILVRVIPSGKACCIPIHIMLMSIILLLHTGLLLGAVRERPVLAAAAVRSAGCTD